jgi:protein tyrosine/serine phosphatase
MDNNFLAGRLYLACVRTAKRGALGVLLTAAAIASYCGIIRYMGNIHVVEEGQLYRSAQLDKGQFERVIEKYQIKSILNLRGDNAGQVWYDDELAVSKASEVKHFDYGIGAGEVVTTGQINDILKIVRAAPKPLLIHCNGGADRSGLVAALYLAEIEKRPVDEAAEQLSLIYGHFPYLASKTGAMDESFRDYVKANPILPIKTPPRQANATVPAS